MGLSSTTSLSEQETKKSRQVCPEHNARVCVLLKSIISFSPTFKSSKLSNEILIMNNNPTKNKQNNNKINFTNHLNP